jgi:hypothetical protein
MNPSPPAVRGPRATAALVLAFLVVLLALVPSAARADEGGGSTPGAGTVKSDDGTLKFGMGPANHVPAHQIVDGRAYLTYVANPGATIRDRVAIFNYGRKPLVLQVYATDAVQSDQGAFGLLPGDQTPADAGSWIKLHLPKSGKVTVPRRTRKGPGVLPVTFDARIPADALPGDHVGGVVASLKSTSTNTKGAKVTLDQRIGVRAYFSLSGEVRPKVAIEGLTGTYTDRSDPLGRGRYTVSYYVHNLGNLRLDVRQDLRIGRCLVGQVLCPRGALVAQPAPLPDLLPGSRIKVTQTFDRAYGLGRPVATVTLGPSAVDSSYGATIAAVSATTRFPAWPRLLIALLGVALVLLVLAGWYGERRRRRRARARAAAAAAPAPKHAAPAPPEAVGALRARVAAVAAALRNLTTNRASRNEG